jgi:hypothetical protein
MERAALHRRLTWQLGRVTELLQETPNVTSIVLDVPNGTDTGLASTLTSG